MLLPNGARPSILAVACVLAAGVGAGAASAQAPLALEPVAITGGPAPNGLPAYRVLFPALGLSDAGHVGFAAGVEGPSFTAGAFVRDPDGAFTTTLEGDPVPLVGGSYGVVGEPDVSTSGERVFAAAGSGVGANIGWVRETGGVPSVLAVSGGPAPGIPGATLDWNPDVVEINDPGDAVLLARFIDGALAGQAFFLFEAGGASSLLLRTDDVAPDSGGGTFISFSDSPSRNFNDAGDVALRATVAPSFRRGVFRVDGATGSVSRVALELDPSPLAGHVYTFPAPADQTVNEHGHVAFVSALAEPPNLLGDGAILVAAGGPPEIALMEGDPAPGDDGFAFTQFASLALGDDGSVVFLGIVQNAQNDIRTGIYRVRNGGVTAIAESGDVAPGTGGATFAGFSFQSVRVNARGQVSFYAALSDGRDAIYLARAARNLPALGGAVQALLALLFVAIGRFAFTRAP